MAVGETVRIAYLLRVGSGVVPGIYRNSALVNDVTGPVSNVASVDLVISNCVVNLSPDKSRVFREVMRVLKPGGRAAISDIVLLKPLPEAIVKDVEAYIGCIAGAEMIEDYLGQALRAGLEVSSARRKGYDVMHVLSCSPDASQFLENVPAEFEGNDHVASLDVVLSRPTSGKIELSQASTGCCGGGDC